MFIDTHCHLIFPEFDEDRAMVVGNAKKAGVKFFIVPGVDKLSNRLSIELTEKNLDCMRSAIGFHPYEAQELPDVFNLEPLILKHPSIVAIGECGLDYHLYKDEQAEGKKSNQKRLFDEQIKLAIKHNLPLIMHCRDAFEDFFDVLDSQSTVPKGVIHCFSGGLHHLRMAKQRNLYVGLDGNLTFSKDLQRIAPEIPLEMLLLETDAPYLTPIPHRGKRNEPKFLPLTAQKVAELQNESIEKIKEVTTQNAKNLFRI